MYTTHDDVQYRGLKSTSPVVSQQYPKTTQIKPHLSMGCHPRLVRNQSLEAMGWRNAV